MMSEPLSIIDLFGDAIMLRDLRPRSSAMNGVDPLREDLGWPSTYIPRKNEPEYAVALLRILGGEGGRKKFVYVGDTLRQDGAVIRGLQAANPEGSVWGFLGGVTNLELERDAKVDRLYLGSDWSSLASFITWAQADGLTFTEDTWALFDLDHTVYAAKGRDDEALLSVHWEAVRDHLTAILTAPKFDAALARQLYDEFNRDLYFSITRANLDYVAFLMLSVLSGLTGTAEIEEHVSLGDQSLGVLSQELLTRAYEQGDERVTPAVCAAVEDVCSSVLTGHQTPYPDLRRRECLAIAERMCATLAGRKDGIYLNREVVSLIQSIRRTPARLLALSDRPLEAAVVQDEGNGQSTDLMTIPMAFRGAALPNQPLAIA